MLDELGATCAALGVGKQCLLVTDTHVDPLHGDRCVESLAQSGFRVGRAVVDAGEPSKSERVLFELYSEALRHGLDRQAFVVALGGGVVGDLAGYAAASYLRGLPYVQVPTSVVAMVDSAVGGKTGINLPQGKNLVGAFHQPAAVLADWEALRTLPKREYVSGLAEVVKYGVIRDADFFKLLEDRADDFLSLDADLLETMITRSCEIKAEVVQCDEREGGLRAILNFGHTLGHALEKVAGYGEFLHGEAISVGMVYAGQVSVREQGLSQEACDRLTALLARLGLPTAAPSYKWAQLREAMGVDKKVKGGVPRFVLARELGEVEFGCEVSEAVLEEVWNKMSA